MTSREAGAWLGVCLAVYLPHLAEEAVTGMADDPVVAAAFAPLAGLPARRGAYLVFQGTLALALVLAWLVAREGTGRTLAMSALAVALVAESHHLGRALWSRAYVPGLWTSLPMPGVGVLLARALWRRGAAVVGGARA